MVKCSGFGGLGLRVLVSKLLQELAHRVWVPLHLDGSYLRLSDFRIAQLLAESTKE